MRIPDASKTRRVTKWTFIVVSLLLLLRLLFPAHDDAQSNESGNILKNGDFELQDKSPVAGWTVEERTANQGDISLITGQKHSGARALELAPKRSNVNNGTKDGPLRVAQGFPAASFRGKKLYVSAWLAAEGGATAIVGALALEANGVVHTIELRQESGRGGLSYHEDVLAIPEGDVRVLIVGCSVEGTSGRAWFDDVYASTRPPSRGATPDASREPRADRRQPTPAEGLSATVTVDASRELRSIPATIYGTNIEWIWDGNGLWNEKTKSLDSELVSLTNELGASLLRFPGGIFSDFYHWRNGTGPQNSRIETEQLPGGGKSVHHFGTDEALDLAARTGSHLMITVNAGSGTAQEAADWVKYVNQDGRANPARRTTFWEIGNELYIKDGSRNAKAIGMTPDQYARKFLEFAKAMRAADSSIKLGAIGEENYGRTIPHSYPDWTEQVLAKAGKEIDFLSVHSGYAPMMATDPGWDVRTVDRALLAAPVLIKKSLDRTAQKIEEHARGRASQIRIAVTEWGPLFQGNPGDRYVDHVKTLASGLFVASTLKAFIESPQTDIANFFKLVDPLFAGWIGQRGTSWVSKAPFLALQMYTRHFGRVLVESNADSPTYNSTSVGWVDAVQAVPSLEVIASTSRQDNKLFLLAINKDFDRSIRARIQLRGFSPKSEGTAWVLNGSGIDANTGTKPVTAPGVRWGRQAGDERNPRIDSGGPAEVTLASNRISTVGESFEFVFPAHSVTSLELQGGRR